MTDIKRQAESSWKPNRQCRLMTDFHKKIGNRFCLNTQPGARQRNLLLCLTSESKGHFLQTDSIEHPLQRAGSLHCGAQPKKIPSEVFLALNSSQQGCAVRTTGPCASWSVLITGENSLLHWRLNSHACQKVTLGKLPVGQECADLFDVISLLTFCSVNSIFLSCGWCQEMKVPFTPTLKRRSFNSLQISSFYHFPIMKTHSAFLSFKRLHNPCPLQGHHSGEARKRRDAARCKCPQETCERHQGY